MAVELVRGRDVPQAARNLCGERGVARDTRQVGSVRRVVFVRRGSRTIFVGSSGRIHFRNDLVEDKHVVHTEDTCHVGAALGAKSAGGKVAVPVDIEVAVLIELRFEWLGIAEESLDLELIAATLRARRTGRCALDLE